MKLELKHLAPYLPYGLKMMFEKSGRTIELLGLENHADRFTIVGDQQKLYNTDIWNFKPILRPLSDLIGAKKLTIKRREELAETALLTRDRIRHLANKARRKEMSGQRVDIFLSHRFFIALIEHHYDVFGLIEKGLAIDINTLEP